MEKKYDVIIAGCGFAGGILAYRLKQVKPSLKVCVIEQKEKLSEEYTWSFFSQDISKENMEWVAPLIKYRWNRYEVRFPEFTRFFDSTYNSIPAENLFNAIETQLRDDLILGKKADIVSHDRVVLEDGATYNGGCVIDARGYRDRFNFETGYQKFVGIDVTLEEPHNMDHPVIIDATLEQKDGFRLMYILPWEDNKLMFEDTYYTLNPAMDIDEFKKDILAYAESNGFRVKSVDRIEKGCTAIPMEADPDVKEDLKKGIPMIGMRGGIINPMTGYGAPAGIGLADMIANLDEINNKNVSEVIKKGSAKLLPPLVFTRLMDRLMFKCTEGAELQLLFQYFFKKNDGMVSRFFSGRYKLADYINIFVAIPPPLPYSRLLWAFKK